MLFQILKSKIHMATVTDANLMYEGSITIDSDLMKAADILPHEKVHILNIENGSRCETYAIEGEASSGEICINGAAAHHSKKGDKIIILAYGVMEKSRAKSYQPKIIFVNEKNSIISKK